MNFLTSSYLQSLGQDPTKVYFQQMEKYTQMYGEEIEEIDIYGQRPILRLAWTWNNPWKVSKIQRCRSCINSNSNIRNMLREAIRTRKNIYNLEIENKVDPCYVWMDCLMLLRRGCMREVGLMRV